MSAESATLRLGKDLVRAFQHLPRESAATEIATHILKFWEPRMRHELMAHVRLGDTELDPVLVAAAEHFVDRDINEAGLRDVSGG